MDALHAAGGGFALAIKIPHVVEQIGSLAGFAAVAGFAILSALYFSQARDVKRLREWAGRAPERAAGGVVPGYQAVPGRTTPGVQRVAQRPPIVPPQTQAGVAGSAPPAAPIPSIIPSPAATTAGEPQTGEETAATNGAPPDESDATGDTHEESQKDGAPEEGDAKKEEREDGSTSDPEPSSPGPPKPATPAGGRPPSVAAPPLDPPFGSRPAPPPLPPRPTVPPPRRIPAGRPPAPDSSVLGAASRAPDPPRKGRDPRYVALVVAGVLIVGAAAAVGVPKLLSGGGQSGSKAPAKKAGQTGTVPVATRPGDITVSVLNGTSVPGLAAQVGDRIEADGFTLGTVSNASGPQRPDSVAMYAVGHQRDARSVARKLSIRAVQLIDAQSQAIAGDATVVVVVGSDQTR
jgi:hypothetical protein